MNTYIVFISKSLINPMINKIIIEKILVYNDEIDVMVDLKLLLILSCIAEFNSI